MTLDNILGLPSSTTGGRTSETLVQTLVDIASKGGNLLIVGPTAQGVIPPQSVSRLREMGDWTRAER